MAQQGEDKRPADDIARKRRQGERPEKLAPVDRAVKHQIENFDGADHNMRGVAERDKPGHEDNHHYFGRTRRGEHPDHRRNDPPGDNRVREHLAR